MVALSSLNEYILGLIFPIKCLNCGKGTKYICTSCLKKVSMPSPICPECGGYSSGGFTHRKCLKRLDLDGLTSIWSYEGVIRKAIISLKYKFAFDCAKELSTCIQGRFPKGLVYSYKVLVPVPLHPARFRWRGFNQVDSIGKLISKNRWNYYSDLIYRVVNTKPQADLPRKERTKNIKSAFGLNKKYKLPTSVIVFDDVWTTGSTIKEAAICLKSAGVKRVWGLTIAR